jgi:ribosome biogenesis GTPase
MLSTSLESLGWNAHFAAAFAPHAEAGLEPARVAREDRERYLVLAAWGERIAEVSGRLRHASGRRLEFPAVGDWVAVRAPAGDGVAAIHALLPRTSVFIRKSAGDTTDEQVVAANVDAVFLLSGLDGDFNVRRIERYVTAAWESGATPVVVLNKADLVSDLDAVLAEVATAAPGVPVVVLSALEGRGLEALAPWLGPGRTVALLGSSGVGKSTLVNALLGEERQATRAVREDDARGRHTTTRRELLRLPGGALLVDTPGMRELQLWAGEESLAGTFPEVEALAAGCRYRDCRHDSEPGCAVQEALGAGALDPARFESWRKLQKELRWLAIRQDERARAEEEARWKAIHKSMKHHPKADRWR